MLWSFVGSVCQYMYRTWSKKRWVSKNWGPPFCSYSKRTIFIHFLGWFDGSRLQKPPWTTMDHSRPKALPPFHWYPPPAPVITQYLRRLRRAEKTKKGTEGLGPCPPKYDEFQHITYYIYKILCMYVYIYIHYAYHPHMPYNCYSIDLHVPTQITKCVQMSEETMFGWWWYLSASNAHFHRGWVSTELRYCFPQVISHKSPIQTVGHTPLKFPSIAGILYEKWLFPGSSQQGAC
jgi:hypothetical protein